MATSDSLYAGKEQSQVKHEILRHYLERFAQIIFSKWESITYIDGFSGPWNSVSSDLRDSSFSIAVHQLRMAKASNRQRGKSVRARCFFVEQDTKAFATLDEFSKRQSDIDVQCRNSSFEDAIPEILSFLRADPGTFAFTLIDPTGWTGFALDRIRPLLTTVPGEVLVNFMTSHITRYIDVPAVRTQLIDMFGSAIPLAKIGALRGLDRTDACVEEYCEALKATGSFAFVCPAMVLQPTRDRPHFHLIYATRKPQGLTVFKDAERKAMGFMEQARAAASQRQKSTAGQRQLFDAKEMPPSQYYFDLRNRYLNRSKHSVQVQLQAEERMSYDEAWSLSLVRPLVWESDLKDWISTWQREGVVTIDGLKPRERVCKRGKGHFLVWKR